MSTQANTPAAVNPRELADVTYTLVINERQLHYLRKAMNQFTSEDPDWEDDGSGQDVATVLCEMLNEPMAPSPAINGLTL